MSIKGSLSYHDEETSEIRYIEQDELELREIVEEHGRLFIEFYDPTNENDEDMLFTISIDITEAKQFWLDLSSGIAGVMKAWDDFIREATTREWKEI